ncbi:MAG: hypothetical protein ABNH02_03120 [Pseudomonadales bacterium]|jgi:hypothetical protein
MKLLMNAVVISILILSSNAEAKLVGSFQGYPLYECSSQSGCLSVVSKRMNRKASRGQYVPSYVYSYENDTATLAYYRVSVFSEGPVSVSHTSQVAVPSGVSASWEVNVKSHFDTALQIWGAADLDEYAYESPIFRFSLFNTAYADELGQCAEDDESVVTALEYLGSSQLRTQDFADMEVSEGLWSAMDGAVRGIAFVGALFNNGSVANFEMPHMPKFFADGSRATVAYNHYAQSFDVIPGTVVDCNGIVVGEEIDEEMTFATSQSAIEYLNYFDLQGAVEQYGIKLVSSGWYCYATSSGVACDRVGSPID